MNLIQQLDYYICDLSHKMSILHIIIYNLYHKGFYANQGFGYSIQKIYSMIWYSWVTLKAIKMCQEYHLKEEINETYDRLLDEHIYIR